MNTYQRLLALYTQDQYQIKTGLVPEHFDQTIPLQLSGNHQQVPFTVLLKEGRRISAASGLHPLEIFMLEAVLKQHKPKNILVFGTVVIRLHVSLSEGNDNRPVRQEGSKIS